MFATKAGMAAFRSLRRSGFEGMIRIAAAGSPETDRCLFRDRASIEDGGVGEVMAKPIVIVVGADKGGVGKTTVARTLLDYFSANNVATRAFDTENPRGTLKRFHPDLTEIVDMTATSDQMKIFDTLNSAPPSVTVIDVRAGLLSPS